MVKKNITNSPEQNIVEDKWLAAISYINILCLVAFVLKKDNPFVLFHAKQGLVLFIIEVIVSLVVWIPPLFLVELIAIIFSIWGFVNAYQGESVRLPIVADLADKIKL